MLEEFIQLVDENIEASLKCVKDWDHAYEITTYHLHNKGSRFIPKLCYYLGEVFNLEYKDRASIATVVELFHNFTLVHDDIIDNDMYRRHQKSVWYLYGKESAIVCGDCILTITHFAFNKFILPLVPVEMWQELSDHFFSYCLTVYEGEYLDIRFSRAEKISVDECLKMNKMKSAVTVEVCCYFIAFLAKSTADVIQNIKKFGINLGLSLQIKNDVMDIISWEELGKDVHSDLKNNRMSMPLVCGLNSNNDRLIEDLRKHMLNNDFQNVNYVLHDMNAVKHAIEHARYHKKLALETISQLFDGNTIATKNLVKMIINDFGMGKFTLHDEPALYEKTRMMGNDY